MFEAHATVGDYFGLLLFIVGGTIFILGGLGTAWLVRPKRPNEEKNTSYESGEDPVSTAWGKFNMRFYIVAIIFILFEVEVVFLFPWSTVFGRKELIQGTNGLWGWFALIEMLLFIAILLLGLAYAWVKGYLDWVIPQQKAPAFKGPVSRDAYLNFGKEKKGDA